MRHHDGEAAILTGEASQTTGRTVGIERVGFGGLAFTVHKAQAGGILGRLVAPFHPALTVGDNDRHHRTGHATEEQGARRQHLDHRDPRLELLGGIAHEMRPVLRAGDDVVQIGHHLAAVADAETEAVAPLEEGRELIARATVVEYGLGPALAGAQHIAVGESATGRHALEVRQLDTAGQDVAHVHIDGFETGPVEGRRHLNLTIDALLAQDRDPWTLAAGDEGSGDILVRVVSQFREQHRAREILLFALFLFGAIRVVAQLLHVVRCGRPAGAQGRQRFLEQLLIALLDTQMEPVGAAADVMYQR